MEKETIQGRWKRIRGQVKERWGELTDDDLDQIEGQRDQIIGLLQEKYGYAKQKAEEEWQEFEESLSS